MSAPTTSPRAAPAAAAAAAAFLMISVALLRYREIFDRVALDRMTVALVLALAAVWLANRGATRLEVGHAAPVLVGATALLGGVVALTRTGPEEPPYPVAARVCIALATAGVLSYALPLRRWTRWRFVSILALATAGCWIASMATTPHIDVWTLQQLAGSQLSGGSNPYTAVFPNIYPDTRFYGAGWIVDGVVRVYPYPPLTALLDAVSVRALGDVRLGMVVMTALAAALAARAAPGAVGELVAAAILLQPRTIYVLERAWTEPMVVAAFAAAVLAIARLRAGAGSAWTAGVAVGLVAATKQYSPLLVVPLLMAVPSPRRWAALGWAAGALALTFVPFAAWDARALFSDVVVSEFAQPFRGDALSWLVPIAARSGGPVSAAGGFVAAAALLLATSRRELDTAGACAVAGATLLVFVMFNKQAFTNYYWAAAVILAISAGVPARPLATPAARADARG